MHFINCTTSKKNTWENFCSFQNFLPANITVGYGAGAALIFLVGGAQKHLFFFAKSVLI
jgi:hypothetical protein